MTLLRILMAGLLLLAAQAETSLLAQTSGPPQSIDIRVDTEPDGPEFEDCSDEQEAASISGEIVVCRRKTGVENRLYDKESAERRHAERTMGDMPLDVGGPGIFKGPATVSGLCFFPPCPKQAAYMIDFSELPDTPPGSDADRIARGLPPLGQDAASGPQSPKIVSEPRLQNNAEALGLPPTLDQQAAEAISPPKSASPEEEP